ISYDGTAYTDGGTACVPREAAFSLTASGADTYEWLDALPYARPNRSLELTKDSLVRVRGVENAHRCFDTFDLRCVVSVEKAGRIQSAEDCPGVEICFEADELPSTTYEWYSPDNKSLGVTTAKLCRAFGIGQDGAYTLKTQRLGCSESLPYTLTLYPAPQIRLFGNTVDDHLCVGDDLAFEYHTGLPMIDVQCELTKDGVPVAGDPLNGDLYQYRKPNVQTTDGGRYILKVTTNHDCIANDTTDIEIESPIDFTISINPGQDFCEGENANVLIEPKGAYTYRLYNDYREIYEGAANRIPVTWHRLDNGTLHADITQKVCISQSSLEVAVIPTPVISGNVADTGLCQGLSLMLSPVSDIPPQEVIWHWINRDGKHSQMPAQTILSYPLDNVDLSMSGLYYAEGANLVGNKRCASFSDTTDLTVYPTPDLDIAGPKFICDGSTVTLTAVSKIANTFRWRHNNATDATVSVSNAGQYIVVGTSAYGCQDSASLQLEARPTPYFSLPPDTSICRGSSFMIYGPDGMEEYHWNDGSQEKDILAEKGGWYILTVYRNECPYSDSLYVQQTFCGQFHFPTAFTPNDNRVNDTWGAITSAKDEDMAEYDLMIFDRNGKKVFHGKRISEQWDGRYKGEL
ncbi:MAG: T9SS type B sorting domain-containing protein, partial [Bacteroidales bacterium]|nr:T9SS type B sorting domain-containing protein [Bacteroidales bacterium]